MATNDVFRPLCPVIIFEAENEDQTVQVYTIHCQRLDVDIECYVSTAIISITGQWTNQTDKTLDCVFALPTSGTIMNVALNIGKERAVRTAIMSKEEASELMEEIQNKKGKGGIHHEITPESASPYEQYIPDLFRLPFGGVKPGDIIQLECQYMQTLEYYKKGYGLLLPLYFWNGTVAEDAKWADMVHVRCKVNAISSGTKVHVYSHEISTETLLDGSILIQTIDCKPVPQGKQDDHPMYTSNEPLSRTGRDFELSYSVKADDIIAHAITKSDNNSENPDSYSMCLFMTPPASLHTTFGRAVFFLLDRSGSMSGEPFQEATRALYRGLDRLRENDQFAVCSFDHRQVYFKQTLVGATRENVDAAKSWIQQCGPERGGTLIDAPIEKALEVLEESELLPFIILITDGAVSNEREICKDIEERKNLRTRIFTLGIGSYCNWFFLKMLSKLGRGFSDVVVYREKIYQKIDHLLKLANTPVLTDIEIGFKAKDIDVYPFPVPDLFVHAPVVAAAHFTIEDSLPDRVVIQGFEPSGLKQEIVAEVKKTPQLPVDKIFIKQKIDLLTAQAWFKEDQTIQRQVIRASIEHCIPSQYTSLIAFETRQEDLQRRGLLNNENEEEDEKGNTKVKSKAWATIRNNKGTVAALAIGGAAITIAATAATFGDIQATIENIPALDTGFGLDLHDDCCGHCDACGECGECDCGGCTIM